MPISRFRSVNLKVKPTSFRVCDRLQSDHHEVGSTSSGSQIEDKELRSFQHNFSRSVLGCVREDEIKGVEIPLTNS
jgi:hypothetical protein